MPFPVTIKGTHPSLSSNETRRLLQEVLRAPGLASAKGTLTRARILPGGFSGAVVMLVWVHGHDPLIVKAGYRLAIEAEHARRLEHQGEDPHLRPLGLQGVFGPFDVDTGDRTAEWSVMVYRYVGGLTYAALDQFGDFARFLTRFVGADPLVAPGARVVQTCLGEAARALTRGGDVGREEHGRPLSHYLPDLRWEDNIRASLIMASSLWPDMDDLQDFQTWFLNASDAIGVAPVADDRLLHGDARLANVLVDTEHAHAHLIDFGNARHGHVFEDLARFELDLILSTAPRHPGSHEIVQDALLTTFGYALRNDFGLRDVPDDARHARCLTMWREQLSDVLPSMSLHGAPVMYRWFLLVECLRRLRWIGNNGPTNAGVDAPSLLRLICALRRRLSGDERHGLAPIATPSDALRALHCQAAFVPSIGQERAVNDKRNQAKRMALADAAKQSATVRVLAETGHAYLSAYGVFGTDVRRLLDAGGSLQVVVCNPVFIEAFGVSASYTRPGLPTGWAGQARLVDGLRSKFEASIDGYQLLKERYGPLVELRLARFGIGATLLITQETCFFEPYFRNVRRHRQDTLFDTFELQFRLAGLHLRTLLSETFEFHWAHSDPAADPAALEERWQTVRRSVFQVWRGGTPPLSQVPVPPATTAEPPHPPGPRQPSR